ncbi:PAS domain S-box protein [Deinococcus sp. HMF7620]|uniref:histidine kinase n=1 Tax=Deinococcus arboris TaxID=2682977 RepID=A0A7C9HQK0_9DEIO|nr:CHASE domain-containing protein [Deinococcus arboris]MVN86234.1 PAS domain S-box protein [Deinococcus arboris]
MRRRLRAPQAPLVVMVLVLVLTLAVALVVNALVREQQRSRFEREAGVYSQSLRGRLLVYERLLEATRANWQAQGGTLSEATFARYVDGVDLPRRYPGVQAVGYAAWVTAAQTPALVQALRDAGNPGFQVRQADQPQAQRAVIALVGPLNTENSRALGFDMYSEPIRRLSFDLARQQGRAHATGVLPLLQRDRQGQPLRGFLVMLPVWRGAVSGGDLEGFLYVAVRADHFLQELAPLQGGRLLVDVRLAGASLVAAPPDTAGQTFTVQVPQQIVGQDWVMAFGAGPDFARDMAAWVPALVFLLGLLIAGASYLLVKSQVDARGRAEALNVSLAQARTRQEQARAEFEAIFHAMQDAAAFTDEDGRIRMVNPALTAQFRTTAEALTGQRLGSLHLDRRLDGRATFQALTTPYARVDGTQFSGETQRSEVLGRAGERLGVLEVIRDVTERVAAERALQAEERRSRSILDAIPHIVQVSDSSGEVTFVNRQHAARLGAGNLLGHVAASDRDAYLDMWRGAVAAEQGAQTEARLSLDGEERWFVLKLVPMTGEQGRVTGWVTTATDIHDRLHAERLAQRNEERYRGVIEGMPQIVWLADPSGQALYFNRQWTAFVGQDRAALGFLPLLHPDEREDYGRRWQVALRQGRPFEAEHRLRGEDGAYRTFVTRGLPVRDAAGRVIEWVGTSTDVDDSVYAENAARLLADVTEELTARSEDGDHIRHDRYRAALARLSARVADSGALWTVQPTRLVATSSPGATWHAAALHLVAAQAIERVLQTEDPVFIDHDPALHRVSATGAVFYPLVGRGGVLEGVLGLLYRQTITSRDSDLAQELAQRFASALSNDRLQERVLAAQADLQQLNQSLEERVAQRTLDLEGANRELEAFSYSVSHDLRTPLRHIVGFADLLGKDLGEGLPPKSGRYLGVIRDSASRMSQLIDDLLSFSRMGRQELRRVPVNLRDLTLSSWRGLEPDRAGRDVAFELPGAMPQVQGDEALLGLVMTNLLSNALKYTRGRDPARIWVTADAQGGQVQLTVRDNGVGFDPRYADKLFGVFQRLHRADEFEGIGIGLANVRRIVLRHGGAVSADSQPGEGATFTVTLPVGGPA